jgi:hypothetical protein
LHYLSVKSRNAGILYPGGPTPVPLCPSRRIRAALNGLDAPPSSGEPGRVDGGFVPSPVRQPTCVGTPAAPFSDLSDLQCNVGWPVARHSSHFAAFSFEFVAKPEQAAKAVLELPAGIHSGLEEFAGFAGSLVMVSDSEARLITVIIFWQGSEARQSCAQGVRRVRALLAPYVDRCLRAQNLMGRLPPAQPPTNMPSSIDKDSIAGDSMAQEAKVRVA